MDDKKSNFKAGIFALIFCSIFLFIPGKINVFLFFFMASLSFFFLYYNKREEWALFVASYFMYQAILQSGISLRYIYFFNRSIFFLFGLVLLMSYYFGEKLAWKLKVSYVFIIFGLYFVLAKILRLSYFDEAALFSICLGLYCIFILKSKSIMFFLSFFFLLIGILGFFNFIFSPILMLMPFLSIILFFYILYKL